MKNKFSKYIICMALVMAMASLTAGCNGGGKNDTPAQTAVQTPADASSGDDISAGVIGEGTTSFDLDVTDADGNKTAFEVRTDKDTVGEALLELGMIAGDDSEYGLYVKTVNGITVDYDKDGKYWAFYIDGEYATTGVDSTPITDGASYSFKVEK